MPKLCSSLGSQNFILKTVKLHMKLCPGVVVFDLAEVGGGVLANKQDPLISMPVETMINIKVVESKYCYNDILNMIMYINFMSTQSPPLQLLGFTKLPDKDENIFF